MFSCKFPAKFLRTLFVTVHLRWLLLSFLKEKSKNKKLYSHKYIHKKTPVIVSSGLRAYSFTKKGLHLRCFCEICEALQNLMLQKTARRLLPISSNISEISLALLAINQLSQSWLSRTYTKGCSQAIHTVCLENI